MVFKKPQKRRCRKCGSIGHNKATCTQQITPPQKTTGQRSPLKFFIHHVNVEPPKSPHIVNLKSTTNNLWETIETSQPDNKTDSVLHSEIKIISSDNVDTAIFPTADYKFEFDEPKPQLFVDLKKGASKNFLLKEKSKRKIKFPKISKPNFPHLDLTNKTLALIKNKNVLMAASFLIIALTLPGIARGYYDSLNQTKDLVTNHGTAGFMKLQESTVAIKSGNIKEAEETTTNALENFDIALQTLESKHSILQNVISIVPYFGGEFKSRGRVLLAGQEITLGNSYILAALNYIEKHEEQPLTSKLRVLAEALKAANPNYEKALQNLEEVSPESLPFEYRSKFAEYRDILNLMVKEFRNFSEINSTLQDLFGGEGRRRYILAFQNPHEIRPTGGFIGSFAVIDLKDGAVVNLDVPAGGSYDLKGQLPEYLVPPLPLTMANKRWEFQDANWFPDFPASAEKLLWFYNKSRNLTADGVIAINATVLERILSTIGPISHLERNLTLSSDNALIELQKIIEDGPEKKTNKPKQVIGDLAPQIIENIKSTSGKSLLSLLSTIHSALNEKEIQAYFTSSEIQKNISSLGWSGEIKNVPENSDYLMVVNTNIQGEKSDAKILQHISHQSVVGEDGSVINTVFITRQHTGVKEEKYYGVPNVDYLRIYVPKGSTLIAAKGFTWPDENNFRAPESWYKYDDFLLENEVQIGIHEQSGTRITKEFNKSVFGNWIVTNPGETSYAQFTYILPFKVIIENKPDNLVEKSLEKIQTPISKYQLFVQKQSGIASEFESQVIYPSPWHPVWSEGNKLVNASNGAQVHKQTLKQDSIWNILMKK